ncbi:ABC transporter permease [Nocardia wallacei]|uniref:Transport permease protein n=1 Tax=Nocardia wallacei TaxID=480035 RepID=A0A7G1KRZ0_9NOCA|nr:ABC transporter permease [Nocardia wallacei]BCK57661.1 transport permease protein [Nocardia wallacei]
MAVIAAAGADSWVMVRRCLRRTLRDRDTLLISMLLPILIMLLFVYVFGGAIQVDMPYVAYAVPGIILLCTGFGASITATAVARDVQGGAIERFRTLPAFRQALLAGHVGEGVLRNSGVIAIVLVAAVALGFRPHAGPLAWAAVLGVILLFVHAVAWIAIALGLLARNPEAAGGFTYAIMFIPYVSSAFVPTATMPSWLRGVADHQPATPVVATLRGLLAGTAVGTSPVAAVVWCLALAAAGFLGAAVLFERR